MAKKKKKNKIKSFLKKAAPLAALALGASALGRRGIDTGLTKGKFLMSGAAGGTRLPKPFSRVNMRDIAGSGDVMPDNLSSSMGPYESTGARSPKRSGYNFSFKKGGRVGCGIAKKGFGRALKKGGKK